MAESVAEQLRRYRQGAEGMISWVEENVWLPIYPEDSDIVHWAPAGELPAEPNPRTGRSYKSMWEAQKGLLREALRMEHNRFVYRLIVLCWMRGEGKSLLACLIVLWRFFCWQRMQIMLGANSKEQIKFVHFDIMRDIIHHSPRLLRRVGTKNIQEKEIRLRDSKGRVGSLVRSISSFSGIVSNITGYTFSEIFDMKNPRFFVQLDGSIRNMPNAFGVIDSTVSERTHVLYQLFQAASEHKSKEVFFSYRYSEHGVEEDFWNPNMTQAQLDDYRVKFPFGEFEKYFQNLWTAGSERVFSEEMIEEVGFAGIDGVLGMHGEVMKAIRERGRLLRDVKKMEEKGLFDTQPELGRRIDDIESRLWSVDSTYGRGVVDSALTISDPAPTLEVLNRLGDMLDTEWAVMAGIDMADPMAVRSRANTIVTITAKGLAGSSARDYFLQDDASPRYLYLLLWLVSIEGHRLEGVKDVLDSAGDRYDGIDTLCMERWGIGDLKEWCEERDIRFEAVYPNYDRQKAAFKELYTAVEQGRFKAPTIFVPGARMDDILREEMMVFDHNTDKRWFGSPEKNERYGVQDDAVFSVGWSMYGGRLLTPADFRPRRLGAASFGVFIGQERGALTARY